MEAKEADSASVARFRKNAGGPDDPENPTNDSSSEDEKERDREAERERREAEEDRRAGRDCCKKALKFLFSHIGLTGMVLAYAVAGGFIFQHLEKTNEKQECLKAEERYQPTENDTKYKMWEIAKMFGQDEENIDTALPQFVTVLQKFRNDVLKLGYEGQNCSRMGETDGPGYKWSFASSMLFSVTVMTTIGEYFKGRHHNVLSKGLVINYGELQNGKLAGPPLPLLKTKVEFFAPPFLRMETL